MFDALRAAIDDLLSGRTPSADRRDRIREMKQGLALARVAIGDLRDGVAGTRRALEAEERELATVRRRAVLAQGIGDTETVAVAAKFDAVHAERAEVLRAKLAAQEAELALAVREVEQMTAQLRAAAAGVGDGPAPRAPSDAELGLPDDAPLRQELDALRRAAQRSEREAAADVRLDELKRKMRGDG